METVLTKEEFVKRYIEPAVEAHFAEVERLYAYKPAESDKKCQK
jgi:hypothetical protein